jgi:UrcA family protein
MTNANRIAASLAALALATLAGAAHAEDQHIQVGDLSRPDQAAKFERQLTQVTETFCGARRDHLGHLSDYQDCVAAVRGEALDQLSPAQRQHFASASATRAVRMASAR